MVLNLQNGTTRWVALPGIPWTKLRVGFGLAVNHNASFGYYSFRVGVATRNFSPLYPFGSEGLSELEGLSSYYGVQYGEEKASELWGYTAHDGYPVFECGNVGLERMQNSGLSSFKNTPCVYTRTSWTGAHVAAGLPPAIPGALQMLEFAKHVDHIDMALWSAYPNALYDRNMLWEQIQLPNPTGPWSVTGGIGTPLAYDGVELPALIFGWYGAGWELTMDDLMVYRYE
jgi:hypothetical protein